MFFNDVPRRWPSTDMVLMEDRFAHAIGVLMIEWGYIDQWTFLQYKIAYTRKVTPQGPRLVLPEMDIPGATTGQRLKQIRMGLVELGGSAAHVVSDFDKLSQRIKLHEQTRQFFAHGKVSLESGDAIKVIADRKRARAQADLVSGRDCGSSTAAFETRVFSLDELMSEQAAFRDTHRGLILVSAATYGFTGVHRSPVS